MQKHLSETRTEDTIMDLLYIQGWETARPPKGNVIRRNEYKGFTQFDAVFTGRSKSGSGDAFPDFLIVDRQTLVPQLVIEAKPGPQNFKKAMGEACGVYGEACRTAGYPVIAVGIAGQEEQNLVIGVAKWVQGSWQPVTYRGKPISWIPRPEDLARLFSMETLLDLEPLVPSPEVLAEKADFMNRLLREANIRDELRPGYVGATMLALWESRGKLRKDSEYVLSDINGACARAFQRAGKPELAQSLRVDEANAKLATTAGMIVSTLEKLNVATASLAHDYLGQLYETFFRYTGGNTIGQYFTPRHITRFMADICQTSSADTVIDPACGTGGFLVACIQRAVDTSNASYEDVVKMVRNRLIGYESEPVTAALCVANMILRGDGTTGVRKADCLTALDYPLGRCNVALMNPPFPHKKTDTPPEDFVDRALEALAPRGKLAVIMPASLMSKSAKGDWRKRILRDNSLLGVVQMPDELFQPYASSNTCIVLLEHGIPHTVQTKTVFVRVQCDGLTLKKGTRVKRSDGRDDVPAAVNAIINKIVEPGLSGVASLEGDAEWSPGAYIPSGNTSPDELKESVDELMRRLFSFYVRYAAEIARQRRAIGSSIAKPKPYREIITQQRAVNATERRCAEATIGESFDIFYGMKELHSREGIPPGESLIISPTEQYNGCYGWLAFEPLIEPPFITVAQTGSIGEAFVQLEPCAVNDDCLILLPKAGLNLPLSRFLIAAAAIRTERWRFTYGRKLTPPRIMDFHFPPPDKLAEWVEGRLTEWRQVIEGILASY